MSKININCLEFACIYRDLQTEEDNWGSSKPHPCGECIWNLRPKKDNFRLKESKDIK